MTFDKVATEDGSHHMVIRTGDTHHAVGGWMRPLPDFEGGRSYRFEATFGHRGPHGPHGQVWASIAVGDAPEYRLLHPERMEGDRWVVSTDFVALENFTRGQGRMNFRLMVSNSPNSEVVWERATMRLREDAPPRRTARLAAVSGRAPEPRTPEEAIDFYVERLDAVGAIGGVDLVCLPENINHDRVPGDARYHLETIPGEATRRLGEMAKKHNMYVVAGISELDDGIRYNTAVLIDREGEIAGKYRKTHLTFGERLVRGIRLGTSFPVFETDFGKVGLLVCFDNHWPETARILALKGADVLVMPNAADGRETREVWNSRWEPYMQTRAMDNHVHFVSAVNYGGSIIVSADGSTLAVNDHWEREPGGIVWADCDLDHSVATWMGMDIDREYHMRRSAELYHELLMHYGDFVRGDFVTPELNAERRAEEINEAILGAPGKTADHPLPDATEVVRVTTAEALSTALADARAGTHVVLADGAVFAEPVVLERDFPADRPLVIRSETLLGATVRAPWRIDGGGYIIRGLQWEGYGNVLSIRASDVRVTRCAFFDTSTPEEGPPHVIGITNRPGHPVRNVRVDRCEIARYIENGVAIIHGGDIADITIDHNHIHSHYGSGIPYRNGIGIYVSISSAPRDQDLRATVAYNYLHDLDSAHPIHLKSGGNYILFNRIDANPETGVGNLHVRTGRDNVLAGNRLTGGATLNVRDYNTIALGNDATRIRVTGGSTEFTYDHLPERVEDANGETYITRPGSRNALLCGNRGDILLGFVYNDNLNAIERRRVSARNTVIYEHTGNITLVRAEDGFDFAGTWMDRTALPSPHFLAVPEPVTLTADDVGPLTVSGTGPHAGL